MTIYNHIQASIIGMLDCIQDAIKYFEDEDTIIAIVADGLGSKSLSSEGAKLICKLIVNELKTKSTPLESDDIESPNLWYKHLEKKKCKIDDYCTTCSFVFINKKIKKIYAGQIGDSPIFICTDDKPVVEIRQQKVFSNITDCLGGQTKNKFVVQHFSFTSSLKVLLASDGFGDELNGSSLNSLFNYLASKYQKYSHNTRSRLFKKEIENTVGKINNDDKSAIYIWSL